MSSAPTKVLVLGARGRLGAALVREYAASCEVLSCGRGEADLSNPGSVADLVRSSRPDTVINCAAMTNVDECETAREIADTVNAAAPAAIARAAEEVGARLVHISTDYVFSGAGGELLAEDAPTGPISWYGETKLRGEQGVLAAGVRHSVVRVSWVFGPDRDSFIDKALQTALRGEPVRAVADKFSSPGYTLDIADALRALMIGEAPGGIYHVCNSGVCSWQQWAQQALDAAAAAGVPLRTRSVEPIALADIKAMVARRPVHTPMSCARIEALLGRPMRPWQEAVEAYVQLLLETGRLRLTDAK